jgi:hypothetical protein
LDPHSMTALIRIRIPNADPNPGSLKRAKKKGTNASKRQIIKHKKDRKKCTSSWCKIGKCYLFSLKVNF